MIVKTTKYMIFDLVEKKPKTNVYEVWNKKTNYTLGVISWYPNWRQYIIEMEFACVFNDTCLREISDFIAELNKSHKEKINQGL